MPVISTFFGIMIRMFYREHGSPIFTLSIKFSRPHLPSMARFWPVP